MCAVLRSFIHPSGPDFARLISRKFERGRFVVVGADSERLERQFAEIGREAFAVESCADLVAKLRKDPATGLEIAIWFYSSGKSEDPQLVEELSRCASDILLIPGARADAARQRPQLVESFRRFGFLPDYTCDLSEIAPGAAHLRRGPSETVDAFIPAVEATFARLNMRLSDLQRAVDIRTSELEAAQGHIAALEEKLLKLKQYRRELKLLKEQKQKLRKSPERRIGQVLLAPYRLPEKLLSAVWKKLRPCGAKPRQSGELTEYEQWLQRHRANRADLDEMRREAHTFGLSPLISTCRVTDDTWPPSMPFTTASTCSARG